MSTLAAPSQKPGEIGASRPITALSWRKKLAFSIVLLAFCLLLGEGLARFRGRVRYGDWGVPSYLKQSSDVSDWHPYLRSVPRPGTRFEAAEATGKAVIEINSLGFRSPEFSAQKPDGVFRIACVGGSVVYDTRVDLEHSWPMRLEGRLREQFGPKVEVINAGIPARMSSDSLISVALRILPLEPDVLIFVGGINDQKPNRYPNFRPDYSHWFQPPPSALAQLTNAAIDHSFLAAKLRHVLRPIVNPYLRENSAGVKLERFDTVAEAGVSAYRRNLKSIIGMCRIHDVRVIVATEGCNFGATGDWDPQSGEPNPLLYYHEGLTMMGIEHAFEAYNRANRETAAAYHCPLVDLESELSSRPELYQDAVHFNAKGSDFVAGLFVEQVPWSKWMRERLAR